MDNHNPPKVFISYSWDSDEHKAWVLNLANELVKSGVDITRDQYELRLGRNLTHFMERAVQEADKVILIMTENFKLKAEGRKGGVGYEYSMINAAWYNNQTDNRKFIPVLRGKDRTNSVPVFVNAFINLDMRDHSRRAENMEELIRTIYEQPKIVKPPIGKRPDYLDTTPKLKNNPKDIDKTSPKIDSIEQAIKAKRLEQNKQKVRVYIRENELEEALALLEKISLELGQAKLQQEVDLYQNQYNQYETDDRLGIKADKELRAIKNKMVYNLLNLLHTISL